MSIKIEKIIAPQKNNTWSQVHIFEPKDNKIITHGILIAGITFAALTPEIDIVSFGKEIILRLHEIYYSANESPALQRLKETIAKIVSEFSDKVKIQIQLGVKVNRAVYFSLNSGRIYLWRGQELITLLTSKEEVKTVSGLIQPGDRFILASFAFLRLVPNGTLTAALGFDQLDKAVEIINPIVHANEDNSQAVAIFYDVDIQEGDNKNKEIKIGEEKESQPETITDTAPAGFWQKLSLLKLSNVSFNSFKDKLRLLKKPTIRRSDFVIQDAGRAKTAKRKTLLVAALLLILLGVSLYFGSHKNQQDQYQALYNEIIQPALDAIEQSSAYQSSNPLQAKAILEKAQEELLTFQPTTEDERIIADTENVLIQIEGKIAEVTGLQKIDQPDLFLDLSLIAADFNAEFMALSGTTMIVGAKDNQVLTIDNGTKSYTKEPVSIDSSNLRSAALINNNERLVLLTSGGLAVQESGSGKRIQAQDSEWGQIITMVGFESNVYLLQESGVLKFIGIDDGLSQPRDYLAQPAEWQGKDLAIDGFIWVLSDDGLVYKYISGKRDSFVMLGVDELSTDLMLYTDKNLDNIYLLDRQNTKAYQIDKSGEYQQSFLWPGMAGAIDFVVSEEQGQIYILTKDRIYTINLD